MRGPGALGRAAALLMLGAAGLNSPAAAVEVVAAPPGASSCSGCHASGRATSSVPPIHGRPADEIVAALAQYRAGTRPATVMNRIATGFSPEESRAIAAWLSEQPAP